MDAIVAVAKTVPSFLPRRELASLELNVGYHILGMRNVTTRFGRSVVVDMEDQGVCPQTPEKRFYVYLPKRWSDLYTEEQLHAVQPCKLTLKVTSHTPLPNEKVSVQLQIDYVSTITIIQQYSQVTILSTKKIMLLGINTIRFFFLQTK